MKTSLTLALAFSALAGAAFAGPIDRACMRADRKAASSELCGCIQQVADQSLSRADQRRAAKFFDEPAMAQEVRQSDRRSDESFWLRYKEFGERAAALCQ